MEVILLERTRNLGDLGDKVHVSAGYGRNYLIPYGKAVPATRDNIATFEARRAELMKAAAEKLEAAKTKAEKIEGLVVSISARAADEGKLYGSIGIAEIAHAVKQASGLDIHKNQVQMPNGVIRQIGEYDYAIELHTDVHVMVKVQVVSA
jgi:large subunit ribosomal protein L9